MTDDFDDFDDLPTDEAGDVDITKMAHTSDGQPRPNDAYSVTADELRQFIERVEHLEAEKKDIAEQIKEVYAEAKSRGYDNKAIRKIIAIRKADRDQLAEEKAVVAVYGQALGIDDDLL